ncbi:unnamed protein product [Urochloa humidicola]
MAASPSATATATAASLLRPWSDLPPELLDGAIAHLPFPADRARLRAVCRGWHAAARLHMWQLSWLVLADGSFSTIGDDGDADGYGGVFFPRGTIPGVPEDATCVGSTGGWLALDRTSDAFRLTKIVEQLRSGAYDSYPRRGVEHTHSYLLHNPFSGETVPLLELDSVIGHASEGFEVHKVPMRSSSPDDVIAIVTNSMKRNVILCRPGKGTYILNYFRVCDVAFLGEWLYGMTPDEGLLAFRLGEDEDGKPVVTDGKRVIKHPLPEGKEDLWSWMDEDDDVHDYDDNGDGDYDDNGGDANDDRITNQEVQDIILYEHFMLSDDEETGPYTESPHKGHAITIRKLVMSQGGELLMVRRLMQQPPFTDFYTREVNIFKADLDEGKWVLVDGDALSQDEALFLSLAFCKSSHVFGDMEPGFIYFDDTDEVFDTSTWTSIPFIMPLQKDQLCKNWLTWLFPPELVV